MQRKSLNNLTKTQFNIEVKLSTMVISMYTEFRTSKSFNNYFGTRLNMINTIHDKLIINYDRVTKETKKNFKARLN